MAVISSGTYQKQVSTITIYLIGEFNKYISNTSTLPDSVLGTGHMEINKTNVVPAFVKPTFWKKSGGQKIEYICCSKVQWRELPGGPVVRTPCLHCTGLGFNPWSGS